MANRLGKQPFWVWAVSALVLGFLGRTLFYYQGVYVAPNVPTDQVESVNFSAQGALDTFAEAATFSGTVLVDDAHINNYRPDELTLFLGRITGMGGQVEYYGGQDVSLEEALRGVKAFVVIANVLEFSAEDAQAVEGFVQDGGRLVIIGDPTRLSDTLSLNSLAGRFGVIFQDDYIYNLVENDGSYLNVYLRDFEESTLTDGVSEVVIRAAHSLRAAEGVLVRGDENTYSSLREVPGGVAAIALTDGGNVLALPDLTFMIPPYNTFGDNDVFIDNIVGFMLSGDRKFELLDFPTIFSGEVQLVFTDSQLLEDIFSESTALRALIDTSASSVLLNDNFLGNEDAVIVGLYSEVDTATRNLLSEDGVRLISSRNLINIADAGELSSTGTVLFHLHRSETGTYQFIILGEDARALRDGLQVLLDGRLSECLLHTDTALCMPGVLATPSPTLTPSETPTPEGTPSGSETPVPTATSTASG